MNKALIAERFSKAIGTYAQKADIQQQIAGKDDLPVTATSPGNSFQ